MDHVEDVIKKYNFKNMGGHDNFTNCEYDAREWSAPIIQKPKELMEYLKAIGIIGTTIKDIASTEYYLRRYTSDIAVGASVILTDKGAFEFDYSESSIVRAAKDTLPVAMYKNI